VPEGDGPQTQQSGDECRAGVCGPGPGYVAGVNRETDEITVVIATRNRREQLIETLPRHAAPVIVVDNGSDDGTPDAVEEAFPHVTVLRLGVNRGAAARNSGVALAGTPLVAFADDDSYWAPGSLRTAADLFRAYPEAALLTGQVLVGPEAVLDPISTAMASAPLGAPPDGPGPYVLGFLACAAVVRRTAFLGAGGFAPELLVYGEEALLAMDLVAAGWQLAYTPSLTVRHLPSPDGRDSAGRRRLEARNRLLTALLRRPPGEISRALAAAWRTDRRSVRDAVRLLPWAMRNRRPVPPAVERHLVQLAGR
jgi:N-acetylglucosaminyl-diphospho-decaprenol L-rhamnosyltransferase